MTLRLDDLGLLESELGQDAGTPMQISLDDIDEDPDQPRREFDEASLQELAATIQARGVKQPVSVRCHPTHLGRWMLNFGARRLRAARLAGLESIRAFVDNTADSYDQVIENEQREGLKPLELALFVERRLAIGESQADIARLLGKSKVYVTYATALIDAPDWLMNTYREGRCRGLRELYELRQLHASRPEEAVALIQAGNGITRQAVAQARCRSGGTDVQQSRSNRPPSDMRGGDSVATPAVLKPNRPLPPIPEFKLMAKLDGQTFQIVLEHVPIEEGTCFVVPASGGSRRSVEAASLQLLGFVRSA